MRKLKNLLMVIIITFLGLTLLACSEDHSLVGEWHIIYETGRELDLISTFHPNGRLESRRGNGEFLADWEWELYEEDIFIFIFPGTRLKYRFYIEDNYMYVRAYLGNGRYGSNTTIYRRLN